jgi:hypothetical protein
MFGTVKRVVELDCHYRKSEKIKPWEQNCAIFAGKMDECTYLKSIKPRFVAENKIFLISGQDNDQIDQISWE